MSNKYEMSNAMAMRFVTKVMGSDEHRVHFQLVELAEEFFDEENYKASRPLTRLAHQLKSIGEPELAYKLGLQGLDSLYFERQDHNRLKDAISTIVSVAIPTIREEL
jgi:hypothetical protein